MANIPPDAAPDAPFHIEFQFEHQRLRAQVTGINGTLETTLACWYAIAAEVQRVSPRTLLVVDDMEGEPPPPEQLQTFVAAMVGLGFEDLRIAYVEAHDEQVPLVEVAEILAREQGFNARVFSNEMDAAVWLRHGER